MAVLATTNLTLADLAKRRDNDGKIAKIIEILNLTNEILDDMPWMEANDGTGHNPFRPACGHLAPAELRCAA